MSEVGTHAMQRVRVAKVTLNIGVGARSELLEKAMTLLERLTGHKPVPTRARERNPTWRIRIGDKIGAKVTLRGAAGEAFLRKALQAIDGKLPAACFDDWGNFSFGVREYIDLPGVKYDPALGIMGFDVCTTLTKPGARIALRRRARARVHRKQRVSREEAIAFMHAFGAIIE